MMFFWLCIILIIGFGSLNWQLRGKREKLIEVERVDDAPGILDTFCSGGRIFILFTDGTWNSSRLDEGEDEYADDSD